VIKNAPQDQVLNPRSTAAVALALLDPQVSEGEEAEYVGYIEQCQELLDAPVTSLEKRNLEVYAQAIQTGRGQVTYSDDWACGFDAMKDYVVYVERGTTGYIDGAKEAFPTTYNYERWLTSVA